MILCSTYGQKLLKGIAKGNKRLEVVQYEKTTPFAEDKLYKKHMTMPGTTIFIGPKWVLRHRSYEKVKVPSNMKNIKYESIKKKAMSGPIMSRFYKEIYPFFTMVLAHELFHAWQIIGSSPSGGYFPDKVNVIKNQKNVHDPMKETHAIRYTNQIRIELGLGYIRNRADFYSSAGPGNKVDTVKGALGRVRKNK